VSSSTLACVTQAAFLAFGPACGSPGGPAGLPGPALGTVSGFAATYDGVVLEVHAAWIGWSIEPLPGPRLDALAIRVANGADRPRSFDPRNVRIETSDGLQWSRIVAGTRAELRPMTLATFEDESGWIVFRVAADAPPVAVVWLPAPGLTLRIPLPEAGKDVS
jgi:hypothetical protein